MPGALTHVNLSKDEKRRRQNMEAAKKSYEAKKRERETLLEKNLELIEQQKRLLIEKGALKERVRELECVMNSLSHDCKEFSSPYDFLAASTSRKLRPHDCIIIDTPLDMRKRTFSPSIADISDNETISRSKEGFEDSIVVEREGNHDGSKAEAVVDDLEEERPLTIDVPDVEENSHDSDDDVKKSKITDQQDKGERPPSDTTQEGSRSPGDASMSEEKSRPSEDKEEQPSAKQTRTCSPWENVTLFIPASGEDVIVDASALDLGATQEVELTSVPSKRKRGGGRRAGVERGPFKPGFCGREHVKPPKRPRAIQV